MPRRCPVLIAVLLAGLVLSAACGGDDAGDGADPVTGSTVEDVGELADTLDGVGEGCTLEYEGLADGQRELSVCTLGGEIAELSVWNDPSSIDPLVEAASESGDPIVVGGNWTVDVADPDLAAEIADAAGGAVRP